MKKVWIEWLSESQQSESIETYLNRRKIIFEKDKIILELNESDSDDKAFCTQEFLNNIDSQVKACANIIQMVSGKGIIVKKCSLHSSLFEGNHNVTTFPDPVILNMSINEPDTIASNDQGVEITNSKRLKLNNILELIRIFSDNEGKDDVLKFILDCYNKSLKSNDLSVSALYDIRDALKANFKNEKTAKSQLKISNTSWRRMGDIANSLPISQSRHKGEKVNLREITQQELVEIREIATKMIISYLKYIGKNSKATKP